MNFRVEGILINDAISLDFRAEVFPLIFLYKNTFYTACPSILHRKR